MFNPYMCTAQDIVELHMETYKEPQLNFLALQAEDRLWLRRDQVAAT
jgi:hypothetical protein